MDKIEYLQVHEMKEIYEKVYNIIQKYFGNDDDDINVGPSMEDNQYQFNPNVMNNMNQMDNYNF